MAFLLFLIVFVITYNFGTARPSVDGDSNSITNGLIGYSSDEMKFIIPTVIKPGTIIQIKGKLNKNTANKMFRVALTDNTDTANCKINVDLETGNITVIPPLEGNESEIYDLSPVPEIDAQDFILRIVARTYNSKEMLAIFFQINDAGESNQLICDVETYKNISFIRIQEGVTHVDSLAFEFNTEDH